MSSTFKNKIKISHIAGTFLIDASGSFLNGAGLGSGEDKNYSISKPFRTGLMRRVTLERNLTSHLKQIEDGGGTQQTKRQTGTQAN
jgi:hypothetical protein